MGQSNAAVRQWMGNPKRFADLFNATVLNGEQVIRPEELEPVDGEEDILLTEYSGVCVRAVRSEGNHRIND